MKPLRSRSALKATGPWKAETYLIAILDTPYPKEGLTYLGCGFAPGITGSPKGRRKPTWGLTHIGTGHLIARIQEDLEPALAIAQEIAECADWSFEGLLGWQNVCPDLKERVAPIFEKYKAQLEHNGHGPMEAAAQSIAIARAS